MFPANNTVHGNKQIKKKFKGYFIANEGCHIIIFILKLMHILK